MRVDSATTKRGGRQHLPNILGIGSGQVGQALIELEENIPPVSKVSPNSKQSRFKKILESSAEWLGIEPLTLVGYLTKAKKVLKFSTRFFGIEPLRWLGYLTALITFLLFTTMGNKALNDIARMIQLAPRPTNDRLKKTEIDGYKYDAFYANDGDFSKVHEVMKILNIDPYSLDKNQDRTVPILSTREGVQKLKEILKSKKVNSRDENINNDIDDVLTILNRIDALDKLIFGKNGIDSSKFKQGWIPNCQIMATVKGLSFTPENIQELKGMIEVTRFDFDKKEFDTVVHIDGITIPVPFTKLVHWMSPKDFDLSHSTDDSLVLSILAYAIEEAANRYDKVPHLVDATSPTLVTGKNYNTFAVWSLDDDNLRDILKLAPEKLIIVGSYIKDEDFTVDFVLREINAKLKIKTPPVISNEKAGSFRDMIKRRMDEFLITSKTSECNEIKQDQSAPDTSQVPPISKTDPVQSENPGKPNSDNSIPNVNPLFLIFGRNKETKNHSENSSSTQDENKRNIIPQHEYAVKGYKHDGEKDIIYLTDAYGGEYAPLDLEEFRKRIASIAVERGHAPNINKRSLAVLAIVLGSVAGTRILANRGNRLLYPDYRNLLNSGIYKIWRLGTKPFRSNSQS